MVLVPRAVRVRTASGWQDVALVGPQGPAGGPIDVKRIAGQYENYNGPITPTSATNIYCDAAGTIPVRLTFTPPVDAWLDAELNMGIVEKGDANYNYLWGMLKLTPPDVDGIDTAQHYLMQHASVNIYDHRYVHRMFKLAAGTSYILDALVQCSAGSWRYHAGKWLLWMEGRLWARGAPLAPSGMLNSQVINGQYTRNVSIALPSAGGELGASGMGSSMRFTYTPPVDCWWEVSYEMNQVMRSVAGWKYMFIDMLLHAGTMPAIAGAQRSHVANDQLARGILSLYGAGGPQYGSVICRKILGLSAGVTYTVKPNLGAEDANFNAFFDDEQWTAYAKAWPR